MPADMDIASNLERLGIVLPDPPDSVGSYVPATKAGELLFISGQIPTRNGKLVYTGLATDDNIPEAQDAARLCAINILAQIKKYHNLNIKRVVKMSGFVACAAGFSRQPEVLNAASDLVSSVFGEAGRHARIAVGVSCLPLDAMVEIDAIVHM